MSRKYTHVKQYEAEILELKAQGISNREIGQKFGLSLKQMENLLTRHNRRKKLVMSGVMPRRGGRPKRNELAEDKKDSEINRLKMENELLRDFLRTAGRM